MSKKCCIFISVGVAVVLIIALVVTLAVILTQQPSATNVDNLLSENAIFPNGSFTLKAADLQQGPKENAPLDSSPAALATVNIVVEDSSLVAEAGRLSFFYVWLPAQNLRTADSEPSIGIRFGEADDINVIPLSLADEPNSGLMKVQRQSDGSVIYKVNVGMPISMCSEQSSSTCQLTVWRPYSVSSNGVQASAGVTPVDLPVACGSQCESDPTSLCAVSCSSCQDDVVSGANTPISRRYNMRKSSGQVTLQYQTYTVKDRITAFSNDKMTYDSGCVGTKVWKSATVNFSGSPELRIDVEPNCDGTTSTAWDFKVACPDPCETTAKTNGQVVVQSLGQEVKQGETVYITRDAQFPTLTATFCGSTALKWELIISPPQGKDNVCNTSNYDTMAIKWDIKAAVGSNIQGGNAILSWSGKISGSLDFKILGIQPSKSDVVTKIRSLTPPWYAEYVAIHESGPNGPRQFESNGYPLKSNDSGYGIFQLTKGHISPDVTCDQVWSWIKNCERGVSELKSKQSYANGWMNNQRSQANYKAVPTKIEGNCVFADGTARVIEHAVALKAFNGASCGNYCAWDNSNSDPTKHDWKFNVYNDKTDQPCGGFNYVNRICQEVPPS